MNRKLSIGEIAIIVPLIAALIAIPKWALLAGIIAITAVAFVVAFWNWQFS